jgi:hypothetical protein
MQNGGSSIEDAPLPIDPDSENDDCRPTQERRVSFYSVEIVGRLWPPPAWRPRSSASRSRKTRPHLPITISTILVQASDPVLLSSAATMPPTAPAPMMTTSVFSVAMAHARDVLCGPRADACLLCMSAAVKNDWAPRKPTSFQPATSLLPPWVGEHAFRGVGAAGVEKRLCRRIGELARLGETELVRLGVCALRRQAIRQPHLRPHAGEKVRRHALAARRRDHMIDGSAAAERASASCPSRALVSSPAITSLARTVAAICSAAAPNGLPIRASMLEIAPREIVGPNRPSHSSVRRLKPRFWQPCR